MGDRAKHLGSKSGCGSVGKAVASDTRDPQFESSHQQTLYYLGIYCQKDKKKREKRPALAQF